MSKTTLILASLLSIVAGLLHASLVAFHNIASPPLETIFFFVSGIAQIAVSVWFVRSEEFKPAVVLFVINGALASMWALTRLFRAPFMDSPKGLSTLGVSVILLGVGSMVCTALWKWSKKHSIKKAFGYSYAAVIVGAVVLSLTLGSFAYASGRLGEVVMPNRELNHNHAHGGHTDNNDHSSGQNEKHQDDNANTKTDNTNETKEDKERTQNKEKSDSQDDSHGHSDEHAHS
ncbi:MAG: hypothetical protein ABEJ24_04970 [Candidatus Magasanikbacteria bacterium]